MSDHVYAEPPAPLRADEFVQVTVHVHLEDLASFYAAVARWWEEVADEGSKGRVRVS
jgi:ABC-type uncharacterized transport system fused permease/ATPase subunit